MGKYKYIAEGIGAFVLTLAVSFSLAGYTPFLPTPLVAGLVLGMFVLMIGPLSGAHLNPAITLAVWATRGMGTRDAASYILAQFIGGGIAYVVFRMLVRVVSVTIPSMPDGVIVLGEALGTFLFSLGVASVVYEKVSVSLWWRAVIVGGFLWIGGHAGATLGTGVLNPAVAFGLNMFSWMHLVGPFVGAVAGMVTVRVVSRMPLW